MKLHDFEEHIDPAILMRGKGVFESGAILDITESQPGTWKASVMGSNLYKTKVRVLGQKVVSSRCSCPYDHGPYCKHEVAVLFEVRDGAQKREKEKEMLPDDEILSIAKGLSKKKLLQFFIGAAERHPVLREEFRIRFAAGEMLDDEKLDYGQMIRDVVEGGQSRYSDFIDEWELAKVIDKLIDRANLFLEVGNVLEVLRIVEDVFDTVPGYLELIEEDSSGVDEALDEILGLAVVVLEGDDQSLAEGSRDLLISLLFSVDAGMGIDDMIWEVISEHELPKKDAQDLKVQLELQVSMEVSRGKGSFWGAEKWIERSLEFVQKYFPDLDQTAFLEQYLFIPKIRIKLVEARIAAGDYHQAKLMAREGIRLEETQPHNDLRRWQKLLLEIARLEEDDAAERVFADQLFFTGRSYDFQYYDILKSAYATKDWPAKVEKLLKKTEGDKEFNLGSFGTYSNHRYTDAAEILHREGYHERLMALLQKSQAGYDTLLKYLPALKPQYSAELIALLQPIILIAATQTGSRNHYQSIADMLKSLDQLEGGKAERERMVRQMRIAYPRRSAMLEVFLKVFG
jgi:hypothetical protein